MVRKNLKDLFFLPSENLVAICFDLHYVHIFSVPSECKNLMEAAGMSATFGKMVAHVVHSLTIEDLQKFNPNVGVDNRVPTINMDLTSDDVFLRSAPHAPVSGGGQFDTYR